MYPTLDEYLIKGSVNQEKRMQKLDHDILEEIKYNRRRIAVKDHYKLLDDAASDLNQDLIDTDEPGAVGESKNLSEFIFDHNTGKAMHYTRKARDFVEA